MIVRNHIKYYTIEETAQMLDKYVNFFYTVAKRKEYPQPEIIDGIRYYSINSVRKLQGVLEVEKIKEKEFYNSREVAELVGRSRQTIVNWCKHSDTLEGRGESRLIPAPDMIGKGRRRYWNKESIEEIQFFADNIERGDMVEFNREIWGKK